MLMSHSRISTFEQCPLKYKFQYIDKLEKGRESVESFLGSRVHEVLEKLYSDLKFEQLLSLPALIAYFNIIWDKGWNDNVLISKKDLTKDNYKLMGEKFISEFYTRFYPFDQERIISTEKKVVIELDSDHKMQGYIDRLGFKDGCYFIHDYKTSASLPLQEYVDSDRQLALYCIAIKQGFKDAKDIKLVWHYLAFDKDIVSKRSDEELELLKKETIKVIDEIMQTKVFSPVVSKLCDWCEFRNSCPEWSHLAKLESKSVEEFKKDEGVILVDKFALLKQEMCGKEKELDQLRLAIVNYCKQFKINIIFGSDNKVSWSEVECLKFPSKGSKERDDLINLLKKENKFDDVSDLDLYSLSKIIKGNCWDKELIKKLKCFVSLEKSERLHLGKRKED